MTSHHCDWLNMAIHKNVIRFIFASWMALLISTSDRDPCFLKTDINASIFCRTGIAECNFASLQETFPLLYGQYKSDSPRKVDVTTFCQEDRDGGSRQAGLQYQFTPPDHSGVTGTRGFEVRLEGSLSNFRCTIIHLDAFLTMDDTSISFQSSFFPVRRNTPFIIVVYSLPRQYNNSYRNEIHVTSESCDKRTVASGNWSPAYFNVSYDVQDEQLNIKFEAPPTQFQFDQFTVTLIQQMNTKKNIYHHRVNKTEFTMPNIKPGEYEIRVEPYNPRWGDVKYCKCKKTDGRCGSCLVFGKKYTAKITEIVTTTGSYLVLDTDDNKDTQNMAVILVPLLVILVFICIIVSIAAVSKRRHQLRSNKERECLLDDSPQIELFISENSGSLRHIAEKLGTIISSVFGDKIKVEHKSLSNEIRTNNLKVYIIEPGTAIEMPMDKCREELSGHTKDTRKEVPIEKLIEKFVIITFESVTNDNIDKNRVVHFQLMFEISKFINHLNTHINESASEACLKMGSTSYKHAFEELETLINDIKQRTKGTEKISINNPINNVMLHGELLASSPSRSFSNSNSEPDSGIRSGDELESLTSSDETMNERTKRLNTVEYWNTKSRRPNYANTYGSSGYKRAGDLDNLTINVDGAVYDDTMLRHAKCPSDVHFFAPEPSEYSEYGEDVFLEDLNYGEYDSVCPMLKTNPYQRNIRIPEIVVYEHIDSYDTPRYPSVKYKGRQDNKVKSQNQKQIHSSMESLMDKMEVLNTRYKHYVEDENFDRETK